MTCEDCGTRLNAGVCSNCHEELYIMSFQADYIDELSEDFFLKAKDQESAAKENRRREKRREWLEIAYGLKEGD